MKKVKVFSFKDSRTFEHQINSWLSAESLRKIIDIQYQPISIASGPLFTALVIYDEPKWVREIEEDLEYE